MTKPKRQGRPQRRRDRPGPLCVLHLVDMNGEAGWEASWSPSGELTDVVECGWLVSQNQHMVVLVRGLTDPANAETRGTGAVLRVPSSCVRLIQYVYEPRV